MSAFLAAATIPSALLASVWGRRVQPIFALPCYGLVSMAFVLLLRRCFAGQPLLLENLGVYLPLSAFNGMMLELALVHPRRQPLQALRDAVMMCLGFLLVAAFLSGARELLGTGTLWDRPVAAPIRMPGLVLPFGGFILIGFLSAFFRRIDGIIVGRMLHRSRQGAQEGGEGA